MSYRLFSLPTTPATADAKPAQAASAVASFNPYLFPYFNDGSAPAPKKTVLHTLAYPLVCATAN